MTRPDNVPATELEQVLAMFDRCGIPYQRYTDTRDKSTEVTVAPVSGDDGADPVPPLTGDAWASTDYRFNPEGQLVGIWMSGD